MGQLLQGIFDSQGFEPHGYCFLWTRSLLWLYIVSDTLIALSYYSIPIALIYFVRKRRDLAFNWVFLFFAAFIIACGTTHLIAIWTLWTPLYWLDAAVKAITAGASVVTAVALWPLIPKALALPSPAQLEAANVALQGEIIERNRAQEALRTAYDEVETRVRERTRELARITEALQAEIAERRQGEQRLRLQSAALESAANAIVITDREGNIIWVNSAFATLTGYTSEEVLDRNPSLLKSGKHDENFYRYLWETILAGQVWHGEIINRRKDGSLYIEDQTITPVRSECGEIEHFIAIKQDITQRKQAEESLTLFRSLIDHTNDAIEVIDPGTARFLDVNEKACRAHGYTREEYLALTVAEIDPVVGVRHWAEVREEMQRSGSGIYDTQHRRKDGSMFPVEVNCTYIRLDRDYMLAVVRDITERKRFEAQLEATIEARTRELQATNARLQKATRQAEEASRHKSQFLANMSHELRTPLNSILGFAELLQDPQFGALTPKQARYLGHIHSSGQHLLGLINDLLDLSKVEAGKLELRPETFLLIDALTAALEQFRTQVDAKGMTLTMQVEEAPEMLVADPLRFKQILYNLLSNAVKFTPAGGAITVTARRRSPPTPGDFVEIAVSDTGIGIKTEDLSRLFEEFTQLEGSLDKPQQGTGLGLALTRRLVELHGGTITVASPGEGQGSTFTVTLPLRPLRTQGRVLLVEEEAQLGAQIAVTLQKAGFGVDLVGDGEAALAQAEQVPADVVILDLALSGLPGVEVLRRLHADGFPHLPILVLVSCAGDPVQEALALGAEAFLVKPVSLGLLTDAVKRLLGRGEEEGSAPPARANTNTVH